MPSLNGCSKGAKGTGSPPAPGIGPILRARPRRSLRYRPRDLSSGWLSWRSVVPWGSGPPQLRLRPWARFRPWAPSPRPRSTPTPPHATTSRPRSTPAPCYYIPAPVYSYPARTLAYQPRRSDSYPVPTSSAQDYSQPNRSYSYYDQDGIEHDSRYPHWSFDTRRARPSGGG